MLRAVSTSRDDVIDALRPIEDPELHRSIVELDMVRDVVVDLPLVRVQVALTIPGCPLKAEIQTRVTDALEQLPGVDAVEVDFTSMNDEERAPVLIDQMIVPPEAYGVRCISMGFFVEEDQPVIWRGPMLHKALEQFLTDVFWDEPDFLLVDLPPGTGDISISLSQFLPRAQVLVVTTPQPAAQRVAQRAGTMAAKVNLQVVGVVENMSWFTGDDGVRYELFGAGGGQQLAERLDVPLLGQVPLVPALREGGDSGRPITAVDPEAEASQAFRAVAERLAVELAPTRRTNPELRIL